MATILVIDLGKSKSVACVYESHAEPRVRRLSHPQA